MVAENTLLHGETLLIVSSSDATNSHTLRKTIPEDVTLEFLTEGVTFDFLGDSLIHENTATRLDKAMQFLQLVFIIDIDGHLRTESGIANVKLHRELANCSTSVKNQTEIKNQTYLHIYSICSNHRIRFRALNKKQREFWQSFGGMKA